MRDRLLGPDDPPDSHPRHPERLREPGGHDHFGIPPPEGRRRPVAGDFGTAIHFVRHDPRAHLSCQPDDLIHLGGSQYRASRIVWIGDENELRALGDRFPEALNVERPALDAVLLTLHEPVRIRASGIRARQPPRLQIVGDHDGRAPSLVEQPPERTEVRLGGPGGHQDVAGGRPRIEGSNVFAQLGSPIGLRVFEPRIEKRLPPGVTR